MSEFFGLWKRQNIPACTNSVRVFITLMLDTIRKKKKKKKTTQRQHAIQKFCPGDLAVV